MIIVTGANGFIGSAIVWQLNQQGLKDIVCVDTVSLEQRPELLKKYAYKKFLLKDEIWDFLRTPEAKNQVEWIIHMGACSDTTETNAEFLWENNTEYTQRLWEWCTTHQKGYIYASSAATYGAGELGFHDSLDSEQLRPLNLYGESKVKFDRWARRQSTTPKHWYGLKFFNVYGPNEYHKNHMASVVFKSFHQIKDKGEVGLFKSYKSEYKDGEQLRDFVYVKDITNWISELMTKKPKSSIYNMGFGKSRSWLDLARGVFSALNKTPSIKWLEMPDSIKNQYQYFTEANMDQWKSSGMSDPKWPLEKAIKDYVQNYLLKDDSYL
jgi:ADP-L-glycero-D-manno-heptose 6-epimerase